VVGVATGASMGTLCLSLTQNFSENMDKDLNIELYRQIKDEYKQYGFYIQTLTKMKFIAIASIISFFIIDKVNFINGNAELVAIGILLIPIVSFFLDLKILEVTLHIRSISKFLSEKFKDDSYIAEWENLVWSNNFIAMSRTYLTLFSSAGISFIILWASIFLVVKYLKQDWFNSLTILGLLFTIIGILFTVVFFKKIWIIDKTK